MEVREEKTTVVGWWFQGPSFSKQVLPVPRRTTSMSLSRREISSHFTRVIFFMRSAKGMDGNLEGGRSSEPSKLMLDGIPPCTMCSARNSRNSRRPKSPTFMIIRSNTIIVCIPLSCNLVECLQIKAYSVLIPGKLYHERKRTKSRTVQAWNILSIVLTYRRDKFIHHEDSQSFVEAE